MREDALDGIFIQQQARALAKNLSKLGVVYLTSSTVGRTREIITRNEQGFPEMIMKKWHPWRIGALRNIWLKQYHDLFNYYASEYHRPDLLHAHGFLAAVAARYIAKKEKLPYVVTEHNTRVLSHDIPVNYRHLVRAVYRDADGLIAVWRPLATAMARYAGDRPIAVIPNPVDFTLFAPGEISHRKRPLTFIAVGTLIKRRNFASVIEAFARGRKDDNAKLIIIGEGPERHRLTQVAKIHAVEDHVQLVGRKKPHEVAEHMRHADIFVSASRLETFGIACVEAMACGLPVVCTRSGGVEDSITEDSGIVVQPDTGALSEGMRRAADNIDSYDAKTIRRSAQARFDVPVVASQIIDFYHSMTK